MPKSQVETYTISSNPSSYSSSNISHLEIPANGNDIKIIITEPTPLGYNTSPRIHFIEDNPTNNRTLTPKTMSNVEIVEMSPSDKKNISRGLQTDFNNPSVATWIINGKNSSSNSDRYKKKFNLTREESLSFIISINIYVYIFLFSTFRNEMPDYLGSDKDRVRVIVR